MLPLPYDQQYIVFDSETNGLNLREGFPWQISWIVTQGQKILEEHDYYPDWTAPTEKAADFACAEMIMPEEVQRMNHFDWNYYRAKKQPAEKVWEVLKTFLYNPNYIIVGQNLLGFDVMMIRILAERLGIRHDFSYMSRIYDTRFLAKAMKEKIRPPESDNRLDFLKWQIKLMHDYNPKTKVSQGVLLKELGIPHDPTRLHEAIYDCQCSFKLFLEVKKKLNL